MLFYTIFFSFSFSFVSIYICISIPSRIDFLIPNSYVESELFQQFYLRAKLVNCRITNELPMNYQDTNIFTKPNWCADEDSCRSEL